MASEAETYAALAEIFDDAFDGRKIPLSAGLTAKQVPGWDSFKQIDIVLACEARWRIKFSTRELDNLQSVGDLANLIVSKTA